MKEIQTKIKNVCVIWILILFSSSFASAKLVGHWTLNQDGGRVVYDSIHLEGCFTDGQVIGAKPRFVVSGAGVNKRELGNALRFDSINSCIYLLGKPEIFDLGRKDFTFTAWFKQGPVEKMNKPGRSPVIVNSSKQDVHGIVLMINRSGNPAKGRLSFNVKGREGDNRYINSDQRVDDGKWHWAAIRVKDKKMEMWIDNVYQNMTSSYKEHTSATHCINARFGGMSNNLTIDELRLYDSALTTAQLTEVYHSAGGEAACGNSHPPSKEVVFYRVNSTSNIIRVPDTHPVDGRESTTIDVVATPGEFEPASIMIYTSNGLGRVSFMTGNLTGSAGTIGAENVDIRSVKCWYQAGTAWQSLRSDPSTRFLVPELLLKDDSMVRVDYEKQINYVKLHYLDGDRYVDMSQVNPTNQPGMLNSQFPVYDSPVLLPMNIPANSYKQIWMTIHIPDQAKPGLYNGNIEVSANGKPLQTLTLNVKVLPFKLADPKTYHDISRRFTSSIYYKGILTWEREGELRGWHKNEQQYRADLKNMLDHGVTSPMILQLQVDDSFDHFERVLEIRKEIGLIDDPLYLLGKERNLGFENTTDPVKIKQAQQRFLAIDAIAKKHGIKQVYIYGIDEAKGEVMAKQKKIWQAFHQVGAKIFVAGYMHTTPNSFDLAGDTLDILINAGVPRREFAEKWHSTGKKIWCYGNPQGGVEDPNAYRRNFGLVLWKANFDGGCTYVYHHGYGHSWNDFDSSKWRDHNLTYPTVDGVIDTIAWEGYREGVDDIRYATTLKLEIKKALAGFNAEKKAIAAQADDWLENVDVEHRNLDVVRLKIINYIMQLMQRSRKQIEPL